MIPPRLPDWDITWLDRGVEPRGKPKLEDIHGRAVDISRGQTPACMSPLEYPAKRCGYYVIRCRTCGANAVLTTAGRRDDPRSFKMACAQMEQTSDVMEKGFT